MRLDAQGDDRLVEQSELAVVECPLESSLGGRRRESGPHALGEHRGSVVAVLGVVHRGVGVAQHLVGIIGHVAVRDPDAGRDRDPVGTELEGRLDDADEVAGEAGRVLDRRRRRVDDDELVAA